MKNKYGNLKCEGCGSYNLKLNVSYDGLDEESAAGEGSGYKWSVYIDGISDLLTRRIFEKHILQKKTFKVIADELGGNNTESSVNKAYNRYIRDNPD